MDISSAPDICNFPDELLIALFRLVRGDHRHENHCARTLLRLAAVCVRWRGLAKDWSPWENVFLRKPFPRLRALDLHAHGFPVGLSFGRLEPSYARDAATRNRAIGEGSRGPCARQVEGEASQYTDCTGNSHNVRVTNVHVGFSYDNKTYANFEGYDPTLLSDVRTYVMHNVVEAFPTGLFPLSLATSLTSLSLFGWPAEVEPFLAATICLRQLTVRCVDNHTHVAHVLRCVPRNVSELTLHGNFVASEGALSPLDSIPCLPNITCLSLMARDNTTFTASLLEAFGNHVTPNVPCLRLEWHGSESKRHPVVDVPRLTSFTQLQELSLGRFGFRTGEVELKELPAQPLKRLRLENVRCLRVPAALEAQCVLVHAGITREGWTQDQTMATADDWRAWLTYVPCSTSLVIFEGKCLL